MKKIFIVLVILAAGAGVVAYIAAKGKGEALTGYRLEAVERGSLVSTVATTGTLNAVTTVQVGTQVSGQIQELLVDFNSPVSKDQIVAVIDPSNFLTRVRQAEAELEVSGSNVTIHQANVERALTDLDSARAARTATRAQSAKAAVALADARRDLARNKALYGKQVIAESKIDAAQTLCDEATAQLNSLRAQEQVAAATVAARQAALKMAHAQVAHALAQVKQKEAALATTRVDLEHTVIRSPVSGVVIERSVDVGQTVAASLQAPRLFLIAQDLRRMQVEADVDEADIGHISVGQRATFSVDAFSEREFSGTILQIRKAPHSVQNVVTYAVLISADNEDQRLLPGMTTDVQIVVNERKDALKVPNAALRFRPSGQAAGKDPRTGSADAGALKERLQKLAQFLELTPAQQESLREASMDTRRQLGNLRQQGADESQIHELLQRSRENSRRRLEAVLTPAQREKYERFMKARQTGSTRAGRAWIVGADGRPVGVDLVLGISDNNFTEIVRGNLKAGQQVICGTTGPDQKSR